MVVILALWRAAVILLSIFSPISLHIA
jgi:hypothetical protein